MVSIRIQEGDHQLLSIYKAEHRLTSLGQAIRHAIERAELINDAE